MPVSLFWAHWMTPTGSQNSSCALAWFLPLAQQVSFRCLPFPAAQSFLQNSQYSNQNKENNSTAAGFVAATQLSVVKVSTNSN